MKESRFSVVEPDDSLLGHVMIRLQVSGYGYATPKLGPDQEANVVRSLGRRSCRSASHMEATGVVCARARAPHRCSACVSKRDLTALESMEPRVGASIGTAIREPLGESFTACVML